jgi:flagellar biosynthetic protein FliQ
MTGQTVADLVRDALMTAFWIGLPIMAVGFAAGVLINLLQIVKSIQDPSFSAIPRIIAFLASVIVFLPWMLMKLIGYTTHLFSNLGRYVQ